LAAELLGPPEDAGDLREGLFGRAIHVLGGHFGECEPCSRFTQTIRCLGIAFDPPRPLAGRGSGLEALGREHGTVSFRDCAVADAVGSWDLDDGGHERVSDAVQSGTVTLFTAFRLRFTGI
jgi:hypothetical protein